MLTTVMLQTANKFSLYIAVSLYNQIGRKDYLVESFEEVSSIIFI